MLHCTWMMTPTMHWQDITMMAAGHSSVGTRTPYLGLDTIICRYVDVCLFADAYDSKQLSLYLKEWNIYFSQ